MWLRAAQRLRLGANVEEAFDFTLDADHWTDFAGYGPVPGIRRAIQRQAGPVGLGTVHDVTNTDGSSHVEEVVVCDRPHRHVRRIGNLSGIFASLVRSMEEEWVFRADGAGCAAERVFYFQLTSALLWPVGAVLMVPFRQAMERHARKVEARFAARW